MTQTAWWSQPVAAEGSTASEGIRRQLGKPQLDPLTVLIRETAQNTCDAALPGDGEIDFSVRINRLSGNQLIGWREFLLPEPTGSRLGLDAAMSHDPLILSISDRGTTGLGGPLRADANPLPGERPDFVNFIRNVGERKAMDLGGGSYGFGKGILYNVSRCHVVIADSICIFRGRPQRRLIGAALGDGYTHAGRRFTGRHWLGVDDGNGHTRPLLDEGADEVAQRLGLPRFAPNTTGTTVTVVDADLGRRPGQETESLRDPAEAAEYLVSTMLWNLWPRMLRRRKNRLVCSVRRDGFRTEVPDPEDLIELLPFIEAYRNLTVEGQYVVPPRKTTPKEIGRFSLVEGMAPTRVDPLVSAASPLDGRARHCARMRQADLIVDYVRGDAPVDEIVQYGAVFQASADADQHFADAEPPTHDDWVLSGLRGTARGVVLLAQRFVNEQLQGRRDPTSGVRPAAEAPLAALAGRLSGLISTAGDLAEASDSPTGSRGRRASLGPRFLEGPELVDADGNPVIRSVINFPAWATPHTVTARPAVVTDNGLEADDQATTPTVLGWRSTESGAIVQAATLTLDRTADRTWELRVLPISDAVIRLGLDVQEPT